MLAIYLTFAKSSLIISTSQSFKNSDTGEIGIGLLLLNLKSSFISSTNTEVAKSVAINSNSIVTSSGSFISAEYSSDIVPHPKIKKTNIYKNSF